MSTSSDIVVEAIYQNGQIKLLEPIDLPDNVRVTIQIIAQPPLQKGTLTKYKGILAGRADFSFEEIQDTIHDVTTTRFNNTLLK